MQVTTAARVRVLEYLEFTQLSNPIGAEHGLTQSFRVPGIYTALKQRTPGGGRNPGFRVPGIYTALKPTGTMRHTSTSFRVPGIYTALKPKSRPALRNREF